MGLLAWVRTPLRQWSVWGEMGWGRTVRPSQRYTFHSPVERPFHHRLSVPRSWPCLRIGLYCEGRACVLVIDAAAMCLLRTVLWFRCARRAHAHTESSQRRRAVW